MSAMRHRGLEKLADDPCGRCIVRIDISDVIMSKSGITLRYSPITDSARVAYASSFQRVLT